MKTSSQIPNNRISRSYREHFNPIKSLTPESLSRILDSFHAGNIRSAALLWESIEHRDDLLQGVISKRKKSIARLHWEIITTDSSEESLTHKQALEFFYNHLKTSNAFDENESGSLSLLIKQMMDSVGKKYAAHEIIFHPAQGENKNLLTATLRFVPLWFFENKNGKLHFCHPDSQNSIPVEKGSWMVTTSDGLMESCSIAYLFKHLPLRDWLVYCERNGMPGVKGTTTALPGSQEWEIARDAVQNFGSEFHALMSPNTQIEAIDISSRSELPYPALVDRMDRAMTALWRGSDLSTLSSKNASGASLQSDETALIEEDDAALISETLNSQLDSFVIKYLFNSDHPKAYFKLKPHPRKNLLQDLQIYHQLWQMGLPISISELQEHFGISSPSSPDLSLSNIQKN